MRCAWVVGVLAVVGCKEPAGSSAKTSRATPPSATPLPAAPSNGSANPPRPFRQHAEASPASSATTVLRYRATWANVVSVTPSCWFFSGPSGRDTPLGDRLSVRIEAGHAWLTWDKAAFEGTWGADTVDMFRLATHDYLGAWVISERLVGSVKEKGIHAKYTYNECQEGATCPGECSITADVLLVEER